MQTDHFLGQELQSYKEQQKVNKENVSSIICLRKSNP